MTLDAIMERLAPDGRALRTPGGWLVRCTAHEDRQPSLAIAEGADGRLLLRCFAGCTVTAICTAAEARP